MTKGLVTIWVFDDGKAEYKNYTNIWEITEKKFGGGKLVLKNIEKPDIIINSISEWKTRAYNPDNLPG